MSPKWIFLKNQYKINHKLRCNYKYLIYLLSCKVCGLHYVGSLSSDGDNGFLEDNSITLIDKINGSGSIKREEYWGRVLKAVTLYALKTITLLNTCL